MAKSFFSVDVQGDEVLLQLKGFPVKVQRAVKNKLEDVLATVREDIFRTLPGKYLDPETIQTGVTQQGSLTIGYVEAHDKIGWYPIVPVKARLLRFIGKRDGAIVHTTFVRHPYMKSSEITLEKMIQSKPWIEEQLRNALENAL